MIMSAQNPVTRGGPKREAATRRAFIVWMSAYAAVIVAIAVMHTLGGMSGGSTIDADGVKTQQAKVTGEPQSSLGGGAPMFKVAFGNKG